VFVHSYKLEKVTNARNGEYGAEVAWKDLVLLNATRLKTEDVERAQKAVNGDLEAAKKHGDAWGNSFTSLTNLFLQFYR